MGDELAKKVEAVIQYYVRQGLLKGEKEIGETRDLFTRANREQIQQMFLLELASNADDDREEIETVFLPLLKIKAMEEAKDFFDTETHVALDEQKGNVATSTEHGIYIEDALKLQLEEWGEPSPRPGIPPPHQTYAPFERAKWLAKEKWLAKDQLIDDEKLKAWHDARVRKIPRYAFTMYGQTICLFVEKTTTRSSEFKLEVFSTQLSRKEIMHLSAVEENSIDVFWRDWTPLLEEYAQPFFENGEIGIYQGEDKKRIDALIRNMKWVKKCIDSGQTESMGNWELMPWSDRPTLCGAHLGFGWFAWDDSITIKKLKKFLKQLEDAWLWVDYDLQPHGLLGRNENFGDDEGKLEELKEKLKHAMGTCRIVGELISFAEKYTKFEESRRDVYYDHELLNPILSGDIFKIDVDLLEETVHVLLGNAANEFAYVYPT